MKVQQKYSIRVKIKLGRGLALAAIFVAMSWLPIENGALRVREPAPKILTAGTGGENSPVKMRGNVQVRFQFEQQ